MIPLAKQTPLHDTKTAFAELLTNVVARANAELNGVDEYNNTILLAWMSRTIGMEVEWGVVEDEDDLDALARERPFEGAGYLVVARQEMRPGVTGYLVTLFVMYPMPGTLAFCKIGDGEWDSSTLADTKALQVAIAQSVKAGSLPSPEQLKRAILGPKKAKKK